jgi:hypothetical protein
MSKNIENYLTEDDLNQPDTLKELIELQKKLINKLEKR